MISKWYNRVFGEIVGIRKYAGGLGAQPPEGFGGRVHGQVSRIEAPRAERFFMHK